MEARALSENRHKPGSTKGCRLVRTLVGVPFPASPLLLFLPVETAPLLGRLVGETPSLLGLVVLTEPALLGGFVGRGREPG